MKIAAFVNTTDNGGDRRAFYEFVKGLSGKNEIDLYHFSCTVFNTFPVKKYIRFVYEYQLDWFDAWIFRPYLLSESVNFLRKLFYLRTLEKVSWQMADDINKRKYDIAFVDNCFFTVIPYHLKYLKIPSAVYHHRHRNAFEPISFLEPNAVYHGKSILQKIYKITSSFIIRLNAMAQGLISTNNCRHASLVLTNSYYNREFICKSSGILSKVVYLGVDVQNFRPMNVKRKNYILSVGGIEENKCFDMIIRAVSLISEDIRPSLVIIADRKRSRVEKNLKTLAESRKVHLHVAENIYGEKLVAYYNEAMFSVFVPFMEPFGLVVLESMACGRPVIGIREGGIREIIIDGENGLLVDRDDHELADAIMRLMEDKEIYDRLSKNCREYILENWTWEKSVRQLETHFEKLIEQHSKT